MPESSTTWRRPPPTRPPASPAREFAERRRLRVLAEGMLAERSRIDAICADEHGDIVLLWGIAEADAEAQLTRALAARAWVTARFNDWLQLAPDLPLRSDASVGVRLVASRFSTEMRAACDSLPRGWVTLDDDGFARPVESGTDTAEGVAHAPTPAARPPAGDTRVDPSSPASETLAREPLRSRFRTGLSDAALRTAAGTSTTTG